MRVLFSGARVLLARFNIFSTPPSFFCSLTFDSSDFSTIYAVSSGHGKCGVSVIRVSGPQAAQVWNKLVQHKKLTISQPKPRHTYLRSFRHPVTNDVIDRGLFLWFRGPHSFSGEDSCELHTHGGPAVTAAMLSALGSLPSFRHAEPGEYIKRAFMNGKLDLTEVEGLADLIHAETESQRQQAVRQMAGELGALYRDWRERLLRCTAHVEAYIDFSEEENIEHGVMSEVMTEVLSLRDDVTAHLSDRRRGERLRSGVRVAIIGKPNVGKSSLLNLLTRREAAIVSSVAGTTRDLVETTLNLGGYPVVLTDTAGLRVTEDVVEREGVRRALQSGREADVIILVTEATGKTSTENRPDIKLELLSECGISVSDDDTGSGNSISRELLQNTLVLYNKLDLLPPEQREGTSVQDIYYVSCVTQEGLESLLERLTSLVRGCCGNPSTGNPSLTQARHRELVEDAQRCLEDYLEAVMYDAVTGQQDIDNTDLVICAEHLRTALWHIGKLTGVVTSEEILDVIFRDFCIGK